MVPPERPCLTGLEQFDGVSATVTDFWAFAMPDLRMNNVRGYLAEFLVAKATGATGPRVEWDSYDVLSRDGVRIEVKSAGYLQNWRQRSLSAIKFGGLKGRTWTPETGESPEQTFNADVYVFAVHTAKTHDAYDPLDIAHWVFYVLPRDIVQGTGYGSMILATVTRLGAEPLRFAELDDAVRAAAPRAGERRTIRIASWNCAGAFRSKVTRALELDADVYVIQEAEKPERYADLLPSGARLVYDVLPGYPKGVLVFARPGFALTASAPAARPDYAHVIPMTVTTPTGEEFDLWAVWTLDAKPKEASYIGQAHLALDTLSEGLRPNTVMIGDFNSNSIWDTMRKRNHTTLVERLADLGLKSAYHGLTGETQGEEKQPTFYLHRSEVKPFHIDHCFTDLEVVDVNVGTFAAWSGLKSSGGVSDHVPLVVTVATGQPT